MDNDASNARMRYLMAGTGSVFAETDYQTLSDHIEMHKYLINQTIPWTVSWDDAAFSWIENVFHPIMQVVDRWEVRSAFPNKSRAELFFDISNHWYYLLEKNPKVYANVAAIDYAATYGTGLGRLFSRLLLPGNAA